MIRAPMRIDAETLADEIAGLLCEARVAGEPVVGVLDEPMQAVAEALQRTTDLPKVTLFLTRKAVLPAEFQRCARVYLPTTPLPGKAGGFLMSRSQAVLALQGTWYRADQDEEVFRQLSSIGDRVVRLTGNADEEN